MRAKSEIWRTRGGAWLTVTSARGAARLTGLIGRPQPARESALLFRRCRSLHGALMRHELDAVFLSRDLRVLRVCRLRPWRVAGCARAAHAMELRAGECDRLGVVAGDRFEREAAGRGENGRRR